MLSKIKLQEEHHYFLIVLIVAVVGGLVLSALDGSTDFRSITGSTALITGMSSHNPQGGGQGQPVANSGAPTIAQCVKGPVEQCISCCASSQEITYKKNEKKALKDKKQGETGAEKQKTKTQTRLAKKNLAKEMRKCAYACRTTIKDSFVNLYSGKPILRWHWSGTKHSQRNYYHAFNTKENIEATNNIWDYEGYPIVLLEQQLPGTVPVYWLFTGGNNQPGDINRFVTDTNYKNTLVTQGYADKGIIGYVAPPTLPKEKASEIFGGRPVKRLFESRHEDRGRGAWFYIYTTNEGENQATSPGPGSGWVRDPVGGQAPAVEAGFAGYLPDSPIPWKKHIIPGIIEAEEYDLGGEGVAFYDDSDGNTGGFTFRTQESEHDGTKWIKTKGVDIYGFGAGLYGVGWTEPNEWIIYTVNVEQDGAYDILADITPGYPPYSFIKDALQLEITPNNYPVQNYDAIAKFDAAPDPTSASWDRHTAQKQKGKTKIGTAEVFVQDVPVELKKGQYLLKLKSLNAKFNINRLEFVKK